MSVHLLQSCIFWNVIYYVDPIILYKYVKFNNVLWYGENSESHMADFFLHLVPF